MKSKRIFYLILILAVLASITNSNKILAKSEKAGMILFMDEAGNTLINGSDILKAKAVTTKNELGMKEYGVELTFNEVGTKKFAIATKKNIGKQINIVNDGKVLLTPIVLSEITDGKVHISGLVSYKEAKKLASQICIAIIPVESKEPLSAIAGTIIGIDIANTR